MSCGNPYKQKLQNSVHFFLNSFTASDSKAKTLTDDQMECMQFGICTFIQKKSDEIPYFHF